MSAHRAVFSIQEASFPEVLETLDAPMKEACRAVWDASAPRHAPWRDSAYSIAADRVTRACRQRGWV